MYETARFHYCESELLLNPMMSTFRLCNIMVSHEHQPYWKSLSSLNGWIDSTQGDLTAALTCSPRLNEHIMMKGIGLIQTAPKCKIRTSQLTIQGLWPTNWAANIWRKDTTTKCYTPNIYNKTTCIFIMNYNFGSGKFRNFLMSCGGKSKTEHNPFQRYVLFLWGCIHLLSSESAIT